MGNVIKVGMADLNIAKSPDSLTTLGLGSCIGLTLYDPVTKIGGLVHYMLPDSTKLKNNSNIAKFGDTGIRELYQKLLFGCKSNPFDSAHLNCNHHEICMMWLNHPLDKVFLLELQRQKNHIRVDLV